MKIFNVLLLVVILCSINANAQNNGNKEINKNEVILKTPVLKSYIIEREIPEAGNLTGDDLKGIAQTSCSVLKEMGSEKIIWLHSYVTENKIYCLYKAESKEAVLEHAKKGGFPANSISELSTIISPKTAN